MDPERSLSFESTLNTLPKTFLGSMEVRKYGYLFPASDKMLEILSKGLVI